MADGCGGVEKKMSNRHMYNLQITTPISNTNKANTSQNTCCW